jgi:septal ring factor EnvC (AmiA/AmiB activator)
MPDKPWDQMSVDEKLGELQRMIKDFAHSDRNVSATNTAISSIHHQLLRIGADLDQLKKGVAVLQGKLNSPP